jgi:type IV secretory pathway VirB2 component (pilin)
MRRAAAPALVLLVLFLAAQPASACATCFGAEDSALTEGMNGAIITLLAIVGVVQLGFVAMFVGFLLRSRRLRERRESFRLIRGGAR